MTKKMARLAISLLLLLCLRYDAVAESYKYEAPCSVQQKWRKYLKNPDKSHRCYKPVPKEDKSYTIERRGRRTRRTYELNGYQYERWNEREEVEIRRR